MFLPRDYLYIISAKRREFFAEVLHREGLTLIEAEILMFLHSNPDSNTLTEIINAKDFTKSHASTAITELVSAGYLAKNISPKNKKVLKLTLLPKSEPIIEQLLDCIRCFHDKALQDISRPEQQELNRILLKICENLKEEN